jgi:virulence factor
MLQTLLQKYNRLRKEQIFRSPLFHTKKPYAFIGVGMHSLTNFYPILRHFNIRLKYICTRTSDWSKQLSPLFPGCSFTHDLGDILRDNELGGVFVCTDPSAHFPLLQQLLTSKKNVFVEKPPCADLSQLHQLLAIHPTGICKVGLQRRYWPGNRSIIKKCRNAKTYTYQFHTGSYPQGDPFTELFIHPLDYCRFLFGPSTLSSFTAHRDGAGTTLQLHLVHENHRSGLIELSTHHSWNPATERLAVQTDKESLLIEYPSSVKGDARPARIMNIPAERLLRQPAIERRYYSGSPSLIPALEYNSLVNGGFYQEIETFVSLAEGNGARHAANDLPSLVDTYELIQKIGKNGKPEA